jgi:alpha-galactosidase
MYKALLGPHAAVYGDHVELTRIVGANTSKEEDIGDDFAATLGTGGVLGTKFTWPDYGKKFEKVYLNDQKYAHWKKWIGLYNEKLLSKGEFKDLYVYGYDSPEAYAIAKDGAMYYAFYAPEASANAKTAKGPWRGEIELRGLEDRDYHVTDYVNGRDLGTVKGPAARLNVEISGSLLLEVH